MGRYDKLKEQVYLCNMEIPRKGLALYTWGNVSAYDPDNGAIAIKPSGVSYDELKPSDIVVLDIDGRIIEGTMNPSSDTATHLVLYRNFPSVRGIVHTHSTYATAWAQTCLPLTIYGTTHADHLAADVPCTEVMADERIQGNYEEETGNQIVDAFKNMSYSDIEMVLVACHGPFTWGVTPEKAVYNAVVLEELARMAFITHTIRPDTPALKKSLCDKHYFRKHGKDAYYGQSSNK
ncbi:MAG: L-ribulose-5-phosphate 4-epimerase AraD [Spirochaetes bacterium]|nr:L-ribulose-5-phosphate 4-epimerase AraD [Spirochaetota bacterium]MBN2769455.1 L-ribulose-5-phosphate 4-epimerase AraD [Spirochaetota bacterium]